MSSPTLKKMLKRQSFRDAWLEESSFAAWLQKCEDKYTARCKVCEKIIAACKSSLKCHMMTYTHQGNISLKHPQEEGRTGTSCSFRIESFCKYNREHVKCTY
ncbi:uncharacterized protein LOC143147898 [Ptiloglossa arizonensis]|uniref:uncharacterized protein LOC143147898 n=1 Tax=Ptiloglossa arizonensis TaxID=3350558 RepID=UPI003FA153F3